MIREEQFCSFPKYCSFCICKILPKGQGVWRQKFERATHRWKTINFPVHPSKTFITFSSVAAERKLESVTQLIAPSNLSLSPKFRVIIQMRRSLCTQECPLEVNVNVKIKRTAGVTVSTFFVFHCPSSYCKIRIVRLIFIHGAHLDSLLGSAKQQILSLVIS